MIILQSPDNRFFRRIDDDGSFHQKILGCPWEKHDPETIAQKDIAKYVETMTTRLKWKLSKV
jgi:hypothetical protein